MECSSCKIRVANIKGTVEFKCPSCGKAEILRCAECRKLATKYKCPSCGFEGPN